MVRESCDQCLSILSTITNLYRTFTTACRYPDKDAWVLVGRMVASFYLHLKGIRAQAMAIENIESSRAKAQVIWTMMQSLNAGREMLDTGFQSHPVIMKEVMEFQLEHRVDESQLLAVSKQVYTMKLQVKEMAALVTKTEKANAALTEKLNKANQAIGNLQTDVKKKADKKTT